MCDTISGFVKVDNDVVKQAIENYEVKKRYYDEDICILREEARNTIVPKHNWFGWKWGKESLWDSMIERDSWGDRIWLGSFERIKDSNMKDFYRNSWFLPDRTLPAPIWEDEIKELKQLVKGGSDTGGIYLSGELLKCVNRWRDE